MPTPNDPVKSVAPLLQKPCWAGARIEDALQAVRDGRLLPSDIRAADSFFETCNIFHDQVVTPEELLPAFNARRSVAFAANVKNALLILSPQSPILPVLRDEAYRIGRKRRGTTSAPRDLRTLTEVLAHPRWAHVRPAVARAISDARVSLHKVRVMDSYFQFSEGNRHPAMSASSFLAFVTQKDSAAYLIYLQSVLPLVTSDPAAREALAHATRQKQRNCSKTPRKRDRRPLRQILDHTRWAGITKENIDHMVAEGAFTLHSFRLLDRFLAFLEQRDMRVEDVEPSDMIDFLDTENRVYFEALAPLRKPLFHLFENGPLLRVLDLATGELARNVSQTENLPDGRTQHKLTFSVPKSEVVSVKEV